MEVRKVNGFFIIFVIGYIGLSVVCASIMGYAQNAGIAVPDWIQYVMSEGIILLIAIIYMIVQKIDPITEIPYKRIGIVDVILSLVAGYCLIPACCFQPIILRREQQHCLHIHLQCRLYCSQLFRRL